jgi:hypothetical protein
MQMRSHFFFMLTNTTIDAKGSNSVLFRTTGHEKLRISMMLLVLTDGKKLHSICYSQQKKSSERKAL